jgi:hypothetical protein
VLSRTGIEKHSDLVNYLKNEHSISHGFANGIALQFRARGSSDAGDDLIDAQYAGAKAALRPAGDRLIAAASALGDEVEVAPKKTGVSLRRSKQFALIEATSAKRIQLGLQLKDHPTTDRLLTGNEMCTHRVDIASVDEVDDELLGWLREAYERN